MGKTLDPLDLPSGGRVMFGDPDTLFKARHFRRLAAIFMPREDGTVAIPRDFGNADAVIELAAVMAEALVTSWTVPYLADRPIPAKDPTALEDLSWPDLRAIGAHTIPAALGLAGVEVRTPDGDPADPKGPPSTSNGSTPGTGSKPSSAAAQAPVEFVTPAQVSSLISPTS